MDEEHDGHGGELLGAGREAEICLRIDFGAGAEVADAVAAFENGVAIFTDEYGDPGDLSSASDAKIRLVWVERSSSPVVAGEPETHTESSKAAAKHA